MHRLVVLNLPPSDNLVHICTLHFDYVGCKLGFLWGLSGLMYVVPIYIGQRVLGRV